MRRRSRLAMLPENSVPPTAFPCSSVNYSELSATFRLLRTLAENSRWMASTPHIRPDGWTFTKLKNLADNKKFVKAIGYLMLDTQHISNPLARLTNWDIHPVTNFQVCTGSVTACRNGNNWQDLANVPEP